MRSPGDLEAAMATLARELGAHGTGAAAGTATRLGWPLLILLVAAASAAAGWTGFIASDDELYYGGALRWAEGEAFAGDSHWTTRFPLVLTLAAMIKLAGASVMALHLTALLWFGVFVTMGILLARRIAGERAGWIAGLLLASMPLNALGASIVNCDLPEASFLMLGAWLLIGEIGRARLGRCVAAGAAFGLALLCRETAVLALVGIGTLFLLGKPLPRWALLAAAGGAALVLIGEAAFQWAMTGDPLHRYALAFNHDSTLDRAANEEGNLLVHPAIDPLLVLLVNNEFALLFWLAIPAALALRRSDRGEGIDWRRFAPVLAMGAASFVLVAILSNKLVLNPRYFTPTATAAAILVAAWLARMAARPAAAIGGAAILLNIAMLSLQNNHPRWPSEALALAAAENPARVIASDGDTMVRARQRLGWAGLTNVRADAPFALVPAQDAEGREVVGTYAAPYRPAGALLALVGVKIDRLKTGPDMVLVRAAQAGVAARQ
jgi:4-amino-4-deoxy-L-arabinose transferase-like glycosyltransferase